MGEEEEERDMYRQEAEAESMWRLGQIPACPENLSDLRSRPVRRLHTPPASPILPRSVTFPTQESSWSLRDRAGVSLVWGCL